MCLIYMGDVRGDVLDLHESRLVHVRASGRTRVGPSVNLQVLKPVKPHDNLGGVRCKHLLTGACNQDQSAPWVRRGVHATDQGCAR